jgi:transposase
MMANSTRCQPPATASSSSLSRSERGKGSCSSGIRISPSAHWRDHQALQSLRSRGGPLVHVSGRLRPYAADILAHFRFPPGAQLIDGVNNTSRSTKRMAYGFRDDAYFFLKIRAVFPGVWRRNKKRARRSGPFYVAASFAYLNS